MSAPLLPSFRDCLRAGALCALLLSPLHAFAQAGAELPGAIREQQQRTLDFYDQQRRLEGPRRGDEPLIDDQTPKPRDPAAPGADIRLQVNRIVTNPSERLAAAEVEAITARYAGREVGLAELHEAVAAINALYRERGCVTCQAFLPPQQVKDGIVEIRLVEGRLGEVRVTGATWLREGYILERVRQKPGAVLDTDALGRDLAFFNATNEARTAANLKPGRSVGLVDAEIVVQEPRRVGLTLFGDNAGRDEVGRNRLGAIFNVRSVFGWSDPLTVSATGSDGTTAGSIGYSLPVTTWGTRLGVQYDASAIDVRRGPFTALDITGTSSSASAQLTQPLVAEQQRRANFFVGYASKDSVTRFGNVPTTRADTRNLLMGFDGQGVSASTFWFLRGAFGIGTTSWGGDRDFVKFNGDGLWANTWGNGLTLQLRGSFQLANDPRLPVFEQFFVGGTATVRGYPEGVLIGARGWFASAELQFPLLSTQAGPAGGPAGDRLKGVVFLDHGAAVPLKPAGESFGREDMIVSTGAGALWNISRMLSGRIMLGLPLAERGANPRDWILHVYVQSVLF